MYFFNIIASKARREEVHVFFFWCSGELQQVVFHTSKTLLRVSDLTLIQKSLSAPCTGTQSLTSPASDWLIHFLLDLGGVADKVTHFSYTNLKEDAPFLGMWDGSPAGDSFVFVADFHRSFAASVGCFENKGLENVFDCSVDCDVCCWQ